MADDIASTSLTLPDGQTVMMGRIRPTTDQLRATLWLESYIRSGAAVSPPSKVDYYSAAPAITGTMLGNDQVGNCTVASLLHQWGCAAVAAGRTIDPPTTAESLAIYAANGGHGNSGLNIESLLRHTQANGFAAGGSPRKMLAFAAVNYRDLNTLKACVDVFGSAKIGVNLPGDWETSKVWGLTNSWIKGGHDIPIVGYDDDATSPDGKGIFYVLSWAKVYELTYQAAASTRFVDESWVEIFPDFFDVNGRTPLGLDLPAMQADADLVAKGGAPDTPQVIPAWLSALGGIV